MLPHRHTLLTTYPLPLKNRPSKKKEVRSIFQPYLFIHLNFKGGFYVSFRECKMCKGWWLTSISNPQRFWLTTNPAVELTMGPGAPMDPVWCCRKAKKYAAGSTWRDGERWVSFFQTKESGRKAPTKIVGWWVFLLNQSWWNCFNFKFWLANIFLLISLLFWTYRNPQDHVTTTR